MLHRTDWASAKQIRTDNNNLTFYYVQDGSQYTVILGDREQTYWTALRDSGDITDFETSFKSGATLVLSLDDAISKIFLNQDTNKEIVTAIQNIGVSVALARFRPKLYTDKTPVELASQVSDTTLADIDFDGKIDAIMCMFDRDDVEMAIDIDSTELMRFRLEDLADTNIFNLDRSGGANVDFPITVSKDGKQVFIRFVNAPPDVLTNVTIKARKDVNFTTKFKSATIMYRVKV